MSNTQKTSKDGQTSWTSSWLESKLNAKVSKPLKQTDTGRYYAALYNCGEANQ